MQGWALEPVSIYTLSEEEGELQHTVVDTRTSSPFTPYQKKRGKFKHARVGTRTNVHLHLIIRKVENANMQGWALEPAVH